MNSSVAKNILFSISFKLLCKIKKTVSRNNSQKEKEKIGRPQFFGGGVMSFKTKLLMILFLICQSWEFWQNSYFAVFRC